MKTWNILSLLALFFMVLIPSSFAADLPTKVDRPVIKVGDTWTYHKSVGTNTDTVTYKVVSLQPSGGYEVEVQSASRGMWIEKYDPSGNVIEDGLTIYSPSREIFRFPLEVGKLYSGSEYTRKSKKDPTVTATSQPKVKSITQDKLVLKAGTFNTLKVEVELPYDGRNSRNQSVSSRVDDTFWYSPEVGRWVKRHYNDLKNPGLEIMELESFKRGQ
jgi:hypothetical protein